MTHLNSHARSKRKRKALRINNTKRRIFEKRLARRMKDMEPRGETIKGPARNRALPYSLVFPNDNGGHLFDHNHEKNLNQRQYRKRAKHNPHLYGSKKHRSKN